MTYALIQTTVGYQVVDEDLFGALLKKPLLVTQEPSPEPESPSELQPPSAKVDQPGDELEVNGMIFRYDGRDGYIYRNLMVYKQWGSETWGAIDMDAHQSVGKASTPEEALEKLHKLLTQPDPDLGLLCDVCWKPGCIYSRC